MKIANLLVISTIVCISACSGPAVDRIRVENPLSYERPDALIRIDRDMLSSATDPGESRWPLLKSSDGEPLPCQVVDHDLDGSWDELVAITDLGPYESQELGLSFVDPAGYPEPEVRTNVRLGANRPGYPELQEAERLEGISYHNYSGKTSAAYQMEGPAWENDRVGFRNYLDQRNGMDIFGKTQTHMVLDGVGIEGAPSYHEPAPWGMDVLKVGTSLGSGGIAYRYKDSLYRVGDNGTGSYRLIEEGPLHSRFLLEFISWNVEGLNLQVSHHIGITAGTRFYESAVTFTGIPESLDLIAGIVNMNSETVQFLELSNGYCVLYTHDSQAEDGSLLAMALMVPDNILEDHGKTRDEGEGITQTFYVALNAAENQQVPYRFYALWEKEDNRWADPDQVKNYLSVEAERWASPVSVSLIR